jgi:hypothetical protein
MTDAISQDRISLADREHPKHLIMKVLSSIVIAYLGVAWALPSKVERQLYIPCSSSSIFNSSFCCVRGLLGDVSQYASLLPIHLTSSFLFFWVQRLEIRFMANLRFE